MAATVTHHFFTKDVYRNLEANIREKLDQDIFNFFGKSFDVLFFSKKELGYFAHHNKVNAYFKNIVNFIKENHMEENKQVLSYLYGSICHYVLDSTVHPYIYYHAGVYSKKTKQNRGKHNYYEYMIDAILYKERNGKDIYKTNLVKEVFPKFKFEKELEQAINDVYLNTFSENNAFNLIKNGHRNYRFMMKHGMCSRFGIKKFLFRFTNLFPISIKLTSANYHIKKLDYKVMNREHNKWLHPVDKNINYHYSFDDLYDIALETAKKYITALDTALNGNDKEIKKVLKEIGDKSYATGLSCTNKRPMKYFYN